jgi:hypothetical protein
LLGKGDVELLEQKQEVFFGLGVARNINIT